MVDKAKKRLKALAREQGISLRAAGNMMAERRPPAERGYGEPGASNTTGSPVQHGAFVFNGISGPPDGDGLFPGAMVPTSGSSRGSTRRSTSSLTSTVVATVSASRPRTRRSLGAPSSTSSSSRPAPRARSSWRRPSAETAHFGSNTRTANSGSPSPATAAGVDEAHMLCSALAQQGREIRLVSSRGVLLKRWNGATDETAYGEEHATDEDRFVASLTKESEFFGLLGKGYPGSFYKVYARAAKDSPWWKFEVQAGPSTVDPMAYQTKLDVAGRGGCRNGPSSLPGGLHP